MKQKNIEKVQELIEDHLESLGKAPFASLSWLSQAGRIGKLEASIKELLSERDDEDTKARREAGVTALTEVNMMKERVDSLLRSRRAQAEAIEDLRSRLGAANRRSDLLERRLAELEAEEKPESSDDRMPIEEFLKRYIKIQMNPSNIRRIQAEVARAGYSGEVHFDPDNRRLTYIYKTEPDPITIPVTFRRVSPVTVDQSRLGYPPAPENCD